MIRSSFINQGEVCLTTSRIFVHESIFDTFVQKFVELAKQIKVGNPKNSDNMLEALVSVEHLTKVRSFVEVAYKEGCNILCGDEDLVLLEENKNGYFMRPVVITNVSDDSKLMQEEAFGPVTCVVPFKTEEEVI